MPVVKNVLPLFQNLHGVPPMPKIFRNQIVASSAPTGSTPSTDLSPIEIEEPTPPIRECDRVLGLYFRTWNRVEASLLDLFSRLLGTHPTAARIIVASGISNQSLREIILALGGQRLSQPDFRKLESLLDRLSKATTKRNRLAHSTWRIKIVVNKDKANSATWERFYEPTDPRLYAKMSGPKMSQKVRDSHVFPVPRIEKIAEETYGLAEELRTFAQAVAIAPFPEPQPVKFSGRAE